MIKGESLNGQYYVATDFTFEVLGEWGRLHKLSTPLRIGERFVDTTIHKDKLMCISNQGRLFSWDGNVWALEARVLEEGGE